MKFLIFIIIFTSASASAQVCKFGTKMFYSNGMLNSFAEARESLDSLKQISKKDKNRAANESFELAFNRNDSALLNLLSVVVQKLNNDFKYAWRVLFGLEVPPPQTNLDVVATLVTPINQNRSSMVELYRKSLSDGNKTVIISHSQGNFYAEEALKEIVDLRDPYEMGISNVRIATPAYSDYSFPYTTFEDDLIIRGVRVVAGAPPANLPKIGAGPAPGRDPLGHNFVKAYLGTPESKNKIEKDLEETIAETRFPFKGEAFSVEIDAKDEEGLLFSVDINNEDDSELFHVSEENRNLHSYILPCKKIVEGKFTITINATFARRDKCPCKFTIRTKIGSSEKTYRASYSPKSIRNGKSNRVISGKIPGFFVEKKSGWYEVDVSELEYGDAKVQ